MTIDEIKQALREMKELCENRKTCEDCPFAISQGRYKVCPTFGHIGDIPYPSKWDLNWPEDAPIAKPAAANPLTLSDYQRMARRTAGSERNYEKREEALFGLAGEVGEMCDHYKKFKHQGHELNYDHMAEEAGDVLWYLAEIADAFGFTLKDIARRNVDKLRKRYPDGFDPERSRNREGEHEDHH